MKKMMMLLLASTVAAHAGESIVGDVRVQALSPTLLRIEQKGPKGFEDRSTLTVVDRDWPGMTLESGKHDGRVVVKSSAWQVEIPEDAKDLMGITVRSADGKLLHTVTGGDLEAGFLPSPDALPDAWVMPDIPRLVPPAWGATAPPDSNTEHKQTSGWDTTNEAQDLYFFLPGDNYPDFRREFLKLTGPVPLPPLYTFGLWFSRYWPYSEQESLDLMDEFRAKGFPLDVLVCDTDWRVGASSGYKVDAKLFPDMARYLSRAHEKGVRVMFNDHPEARTPGALDPEELAYREEGLRSLIEIGADAWWYDKNWNKKLNVPDGLNKEFWGMVVYHDITQKLRPEQRPLIMSNVDGIWGGMVLTPSHPAAHRYPIWWTGDTLAFWEDLRNGIENGVSGGIVRMMPYINEDLGGHVLTPTPELFTRWFQFGVFSPQPRMHSWPETVHYPWAYGEEPEKICRKYAALRYRLLPLIYAAARRTYDDGAPLLQRCDLVWPDHPEAANGLQYLFGDDLLVAPQCYSGLDPIPVSLLKAPNGKQGLQAEYFANENFEGKPKVVRIDDAMFYDWKKRPSGIPMKTASVRWTGTLGPVEETAEYEFGMPSQNSRARFWIDGKELLSKPEVKQSNKDIELKTGRMTLEAGKVYPIKMEMSSVNSGSCDLFMGLASEIDDAARQTRSVWLPPGRWRDAWTGESLEGPKTIDAVSDLEHMPLYVREGGMVFTTPERITSGTPVWDQLTVDAFVPTGGTTRREIYEDDGLSNGYLNDAFSRTGATLSSENGKVSVQIDPAKGAFLEEGFPRDWTVRLHLPAGVEAKNFLLNGEPVQTGARVLPPAEGSVFPFEGPGTPPGMKAGDVVEFTVPDYPANRMLTVGLTMDTPIEGAPSE